MLEPHANRHSRPMDYLMSIHAHLPAQARRDLKEVGWPKGVELAKLARRDRRHFDCAPWLHKARQIPKEDCKLVMERELIWQGISQPFGETIRKRIAYRPRCKSFCDLHRG
jgi:hypothetical protein